MATAGRSVVFASVTVSRWDWFMKRPEDLSTD